MRKAIQVAKDREGYYYACEFIDGTVEDFLLPGTVFVIRQEEGESLEELKERARKKARARDIHYVRSLD